MKNQLLKILISIFVVSCQLFSPSAVTSAANPINSTQQEIPDSSGHVPLPSTGLVKPVSRENNLPGNDFGTTPLKEWKEALYKTQGDTLPVNMELVVNPEVTGGLTKDQTAFLSKNGFIVVHTEEEQFADIRDQVSEYYGQPYFLTTDAAFHTLHINFDALLKQMEKSILKNEAVEITSTALDTVSGQISASAGTSLEADARLAQEYLAVALKLFDPEVEMPAILSKRIQPQINQVMNAAGREKSALLPDFEDDYGAYKPVGHYAGDPELENYYRGMTWAGRMAFKFRDIENPKFKPSRAPLIITLAMRQNDDVWNRYLRFMETLAFVVGPTDDGGPVELAALMDSVYGKNASTKNLADDGKWQTFLSRIDELPQPKINSTFANTTIALNAERSWRMMGQRFTLDALIFQNMIYDKVGSDDAKREFPSGLDVMAVLGSEAALTAQQDIGETAYQNYMPQMMLMQNLVREQGQAGWLTTFYSGWLYAFIPQVQAKADAFPPLMRTTAWQNRELNSALGSWAELKHDTALYAKMPEFMGGGGPPSSAPAPGYVEANPNVFYRLAYISQAIMDGLELRGYIPSEPDYTGSGGDLSFYDLWRGMGTLAKQFTELGDIAVKELRGESLTEDDRYRIKTPLGALEDHVDFAKRSGQDIKLPPVPVIAAVSGAQNEVLEVGVGNVDRIFVAVTINGQLQIAQGGVFSYYEFKQARSNRLTDEEWRMKLAGNDPKLLPYTAHYLLPGGKAVDALAFRIGDIYIINEKGATPPLNLRRKPTKSSDVIDILKFYTYIEIIDGPKKADNLTWWKIKVYDTDTEGWVAGNPEWYDRAHGQ